MVEKPVNNSGKYIEYSDNSDVHPKKPAKWDEVYFLKTNQEQ